MDGIFKIAMLLGVGGFGIGAIGASDLDLSQIKTAAEPILSNMESVVRYVSENGLDDVNKLIKDLQKAK